MPGSTRSSDEAGGSPCLHRSPRVCQVPGENLERQSPIFLLENFLSLFSELLIFTGNRKKGSAGDMPANGPRLSGSRILVQTLSKLGLICKAQLLEM